ncbi:hypothetical protein, partial [Pseudomonas sp. MD330_11]|uniref:hypothetical protein n=1 Tax=Pseudomonas sp. MD330_11 TaxID=3241255 RepID=UPI0036D24572
MQEDKGGRQFSAGPQQGSAMPETRSPETNQFSAGPPQGKLAPSGGSALHEVKSVGTLLPACALVFNAFVW